MKQTKPASNWTLAAYPRCSADNTESHVNASIDHIFICCSVGGSEADALTRLGLKEGTANTHPGQGTACRRFFFSNAYLELLWVSDPLEAQSAAVLPTRLWERWSARDDAACPYGIVLRPAADAVGAQTPFDSWSYRPHYMPPGLSIEVAQATPLAGPEFFYLGFQQGSSANWAGACSTTICQ